MNKYINYKTGLSFLLIIIITIFCSLPGIKIDDNDVVNIDKLPRIDPDYNDIIIPPNIAPLNFRVMEEADEYYVKIHSSAGESINIYNESSVIRIPEDDWKELLDLNKGENTITNIYTRSADQKWQKYESINNIVSRDSIDSHLAYRLIVPVHNYWNEVGIYQRNLENFDESPILINKLTDNSCMNCHNFRNNDPDNMVMHIRKGPPSGTLIVRNGTVTKVNTSTDFNKAGAYPSWHPNGKLIAFSANNFTMFFHSSGSVRDVLDRASDLILYDIDSNTITSSPQISGPERMEVWPWWSPDGKFLYYCSAPGFDNFVTQDGSGNKGMEYREIKYDLMRIPYNAETAEWGQAETVLSTEETGKTILEPRISPDGRYLLLTMTDYGNFPIYMTQSDVYIMDLQTGEYKPLEYNSDKSDSFHSWSSTGRWFVFASKRRDGVLGRAFFSHFDEKARMSKPFVMPQEDPVFHNTFFKNYNVPELIKGPVTVKPQELARVAFDNENIVNAKLDPALQATITKEDIENNKKTADEVSPL